MGILWGPPGSQSINRRTPGWQTTPSDFKPQGPPVQISLKNECFAGSSSTQGLITNTGQNNGILLRSASWFMRQWMSESSTKALHNYGQSGGSIWDISDKQLGSANGSQTGSFDLVTTPWQGANIIGDLNENWTIQCDCNNPTPGPGAGESWGDPCAPDVHFSWLKGTGNYTAAGTHKGVFAVGQLASTVASEKRFVAWSYSDWSNGYLGGWGMFNTARFHRLVWADWPGCSIDEPRYWQWVPPSGSSDTPPTPTSRRNSSTAHYIDDFDAKIYDNMRLPSYMEQSASRGHLNQKGYALMTAMWIYDSIEARQGGFPWFPDHRYFVDNATARTNTGAVCTLGFQGDLAAFASKGGTLALLDCATGYSASADFAIDSSANVTRKGTGGTLTTKDLIVECRLADRVKWYHIEIGVATGTISRLSRLDGNFGLTLFSANNTGTKDAPVVASPSTCLTFAGGVSNSATEGTMVFVIQPDADVDTANMQLAYAAPSSVNVLAFSRSTTGAISITLKTAANGSLGNISSNTTAAPSGGRCRNADGLTYVLYSFSIANNRQTLVIYRDSTAHIDQTVTATVGGQTEASLNPFANGGTSGTPYMIFSGGSTSQPQANSYKGLAGLVWFADKEIQFDGGNVANVGLFRGATAGTFQDLGTTGTVTPTVGVNQVAITPYVFFNGDAARFVDGQNYGTGGTFESWSRRDWNRQDFTKGQPVTQ